MRTEDEIAIIDTLEKMKQTETFSEFQSLQAIVLQDEKLLEIIATYREAKDIYMQAVVMKEHSALLEIKKQELLEAKQLFDTQDILRNYYKKLRRVELFVEDLNYEISQVLEMKKAGCGH